MNKPLLSICIPTYSRADYLKRCLENIKIQLAENDNLNEIVEVVISDNCSTDNTSQVAMSYQNAFKNFKYVVNQTNIGFDLNVFNAVNKASGTYCWYMGDDDTIINGGIEFVVSLLKDDEYDVVTVESEPITHNEFHQKKYFTREVIFETNDCNAFYFGNTCLGGTSNLIFNKNIWMECVDKEGSIAHWLYFETVLKIFVRTDKKLLNARQVVVYTGQDCRWVENGTELFTFANSNLLLERMIGFGFDKKLISESLYINTKQIILMLLRAKGHNLDCNLANLKYIFKNLHKMNFLYKILVVMIYFIPNRVIVVIRDSKKYLTKPVKYSF